MINLLWKMLLIGIGLTLVMALSAGPLSAQCVEPQEGLVAWWPGDGNPNDIIGGMNGSTRGDTTFATGLVDQALSFDGYADYVITPNVINSWPAGTIDLWVKFNSLTGASDQIFSSWGSDNWGFQYDPIHMWANGWTIDHGFTFGFCIGDTFPCTWQLAYSYVPPVVNRWYHVAGTWGSGGIQIYVDGELKATNPYTGSAPPTISHMIGASYWSTVFGNFLPVDGLIDEVEIYNRALTAAEILAIYNAGSAGKCKPGDNRPPVAVCQNVTACADSMCAASASIDNGSYDPDGDPITVTQSPAGPYAKGNTSVTLAVTDSKGASNQCTGTVTVIDNTPPSITSLMADPNILWPPNHKMVNVTVDYNTTDNCEQNTACRISSVTSNEPISTADYSIVDAHHVQLRAERLGSGNGRIYTIAVTCTDISGNLSNKAVTVTVPHDQGKK
ncbi:MAG TPA: LamG domain-containing protein [Thermodesulfovibrionales bacterium]|nr:LamG domain-containing protein [Thermodesulfovibrionales bacterium]